MKPVAEVREYEKFYHGNRVDVLEVAVVPTHESGVFLIDNYRFGKIAVKKLTLLDVPHDEVLTMHKTGEFDINTHVKTSADGVSHVVRSEARVPIPDNRGILSEFEVTTFEEFVPAVSVLK